MKNLDIKIIDIKKALDEHPDVKELFPFRSPGHYGIEGYNYVSKTIFNEFMFHFHKQQLHK